MSRNFELLQQIGNFFVLFLRLVNDQAQVRFERFDRSAVRIHVAPNRWWSDGRLNQVDQRIEVGLRTTLQPARAGSEARIALRHARSGRTPASADRHANRQPLISPKARPGAALGRRQKALPAGTKAIGRD